MKNTLLSILTIVSLTFAPAGLIAGSAMAAPKPDACPDKPGDSKTQVLVGINQTGNNCSDDKVTNTTSTAIKLISYLAGVVAVIMILVSGFKFMTSAGDAGKTASARSTLIYAMIGLAIAALAQFIVQFVLSTATKAGG